MLTEMAGMSVEDGADDAACIQAQCAVTTKRSMRNSGATRCGYAQPHGVRARVASRRRKTKYGNGPELLPSSCSRWMNRDVQQGTGAAGGALSMPEAGAARWWFHDSPEGMMRFRETATETAGFYNTVGFNDDTRAFLSIPARHDVARRVDCAFLGRLVAEHRLDKDEAFELVKDQTVNLKCVRRTGCSSLRVAARALRPQVGSMRAGWSPRWRRRRIRRQRDRDRPSVHRPMPSTMTMYSTGTLPSELMML